MTRTHDRRDTVQLMDVAREDRRGVPLIPGRA